MGDAEKAIILEYCRMFTHLASKFFPNYRIPKLPKRNPEKSVLFKEVYKLVHKTAPTFQIRPEQIPQFIQAQLEQLSKYRDENGNQANLTPSILSGDTSWIRWKKWKQDRLLASKKKSTVAEERAPLHKIRFDLAKTKEFLERKGSPPLSQILANGDLLRWVRGHRVSPYYLLLQTELHPLIRPRKLAEVFPGIDFEIYKRDISPECVAAFREIFGAAQK